MLRKFSISCRIFFLLWIMVGFVVGVLSTFYYDVIKIKEFSVAETQRASFEGQKIKIQVATHSLALALSEVLKGIIDPREREAIIIGTLAPIRYEEDKSGYFFVFENTVNITMPPRGELRGKDLSNVKDKDGAFIFRKLFAKASMGGGFIQYVYYKPPIGVQPVLAYAEMIPATDYWIGTGVYLDNVEREKKKIDVTISSQIRRNIATVLTVTGIALVIMIAICLAIIRSIILPIKQVREAAGRIAEGELSAALDESGKDEAASMQSALNAMVRTLRYNLQEIQEKTKEAEEKARAAKEALTQLERARCESMQQAAKHIESLRKMSMALAHQLRNPVTVIGGFARMMLEKPEDKEKHFVYLESIVSAAVRIENIIQIVKEHNLIRLGELTCVDLSDLVKEAQTAAIQKAAELRKKVDWTLKIEPIRVRLDVQLMLRALSEIMFNAVESIRENLGSISVTASKMDDSLFIEVIDNGKGIDKKDLAYVFDPFFTTKAVGIGAGLALVSRIIEEHNGIINIESVLNAGTKVTIELPVAPDSAPDL